MMAVVVSLAAAAAATAGPGGSHDKNLEGKLLSLPPSLPRRRRRQTHPPNPNLEPACRPASLRACRDGFLACACVWDKRFFVRAGVRAAYSALIASG